MVGGAPYPPNNVTFPAERKRRDKSPPSLLPRQLSRRSAEAVDELGQPTSDKPLNDAILQLASDTVAKRSEFVS